MIDSTITNVFLQFFLLDKSTFSFIPDNYFDYLKYAPLFLVAFIAAFLLTPLIGYLATKWNIIDKTTNERETAKKNTWNKFDNPKRHIHKNTAPYFGGLAVIIPLIIITFLTLKLTPSLIFLLIAMGVITISGILDDTKNMPSTAQLAMQIIAAIIIALMPIDLGIIKIPFDGVINLNMMSWQGVLLGAQISFSFPGDIILIAWIILCINAVKWVGGLDGLVEGNMIIAFLLIFVLAVTQANIVVIIMSIALVGGISGFLPFNSHPAKIFTGATGKTMYGFLLATFAFFNDTKLATTLLILLLPIVDSLFVITYRIIKYKPKNLLAVLRMNDTNHLHHKLLEAGFSHKQVLHIEQAFMLFLGGLAVLSTGAYRYFLIIAAAFTLVAGLAGLHIYTNYKKKQNVDKKESPESKYSY